MPARKLCLTAIKNVRTEYCIRYYPTNDWNAFKKWCQNLYNFARTMHSRKWAKNQRRIFWEFVFRRKMIALLISSDEFLMSFTFKFTANTTASHGTRVVCERWNRISRRRVNGMNVSTCSAVRATPANNSCDCVTVGKKNAEIKRKSCEQNGDRQFRRKSKILENIKIEISCTNIGKVWSWIKKKELQFRAKIPLHGENIFYISSK